MTVEGAELLRDLASQDPSVAPLVRMELEALGAAENSAWEAGFAAENWERPVDGVPLLRGRTVRVDPELFRDLAGRLAASAAGPVRMPAGLSGDDALEIAEAAANLDADRLATWASAHGVEPGALAALGSMVVYPFLRSAGRRAEPLLDGIVWEYGHCPVCGGRPLLAEVRGAERVRELRCGRCAAGWSYPHVKCAFCGNTDYRSLGYFAPEGQGEARRVQTCGSCRGYLKTLGSLTRLDPAGLFFEDLRTLVLDVAALERGHSRPEVPEGHLDLKLVAS